MVPIGQYTACLGGDTKDSYIFTNREIESEFYCPFSGDCIHFVISFGERLLFCAFGIKYELC